MNTPIAIINGRIYTGDAIIDGHGILIEEGRITAIFPQTELPENVDVVDAENNNIAPGLIDLQIYGAGGHLFAENPSKEALLAISEHIVSTGTTGFMLTLSTNPLDTCQKAMETVRLNDHPALLGLHLEGPYLSPEKRGAHPTAYLRKPNVDEIKRVFADADGCVGMMTIAPELFSSSCIQLLLDYGILLSAGHSNASFAQATEGFSAGIKAVTHLFNGMSSFRHREPGLPGATFLSESVRAGIIADGIHVSYESLKIAKRLLGDRLFLISDAIVPSTYGIYNYIFQGDRFTLADGTLSGTSLCQLDSVANCVRFADIALDETLRMASLYPAQLAGIDDAGKIAVGMQANIIVFDAEFNLKRVFLKGDEKMVVSQ